MTANDFQYICSKHDVLPEIALEHKFVRTILEKDKKKPSLFNQITLSTYLQNEL